MEKPIIDGTYELKKGKEKGAWTFIEMPVLENVPKKRNGTVRVRGTIDAYALEDFHIWVMKKGTFLSVKADIRKAIGKQEGDSVRLLLFLDDVPAVGAEDLITCLKEEPALYQRYQKLPASRRKEMSEWVMQAATDDGKVERIARILQELEG